MNASSFSFPTTIRFGLGMVKEIPAHLEKLHARKPLLVTDAGVLATEAFRLVAQTTAAAPVFSDVHPNPIESDVEGAAHAFAESGCDSVIGLGGGSALDVAKALRLRLRAPERTLREFDQQADWRDLAPFIAIPTTAGTGSEVGRSSVIILAGRKTVLFHPALLADLVILDPELTRALPPKLTAATGADALTHCIESLTSTVFHPMCDGIALEGIRLIGQALPTAVSDGSDLKARGMMQIAAMMGGVAFQKDLGAVHSLAHPLSSICGLHHGLANALCLPHVMEFNAERWPSLYYRVGVALGGVQTEGGWSSKGSSDPAQNRAPADQTTIAAVRGLLAKIGLGGGLRAHGVNESHLDALVAQAAQDSCHQTNPVPVTPRDLRELYERALDG